MLGRVTSLTNTKNWKEAVLFFVFQFVIFYILLIVLEHILANYMQFHGNGMALSRGLASITVILYSLILNSLLLVKKKLYQNYWYFFFVILSPALGLLGIALAAFLTTRNPETTSNEPHPGSPNIVL